MSRKPIKLANGDLIESNSLVWIIYRKKPWPAMVKRIYPKKITYNFLPVETHPIVFSTTMKNVRIFLETDKLPPNSSEEQREAFKVAMSLLKSEGAGIAEAGDAATAKANIGKVPFIDSDDDDQMSEANSESDADFGDEDGDEVLPGAQAFTYRPGDVVIVRTSKGMWPVKVLEVPNKNEVIYQMFPLELFPDNAKARIKDLVKFPEDEVDKLIAENASTSGLCKAFKSVKSYLGLDAARKAAAASKSKQPNSTRKGKKPVAEKDNGVKGIPANNKTKATAKPSNEPKVGENETKRPTRKRRHEGDDEAARSPDYSASTRSEKHVDEAEIPDSTNFVVAETARKSASYKMNSDSPLPTAFLTRKRLGMSRVNTIKTEEPSQCKVEVLPEKSRQSEFIPTLLSDDAAAHLNSIWAGDRKPLRAASTHYISPTSIEDMDLEFRTMRAFFSTVDDLQAAVTEVRKWTQLCTKLPKMTLLKEIHYIANVVLPEACIFALSKTKKCSLADAADKFQHMTSSENGQIDEKKSFNDEQDQHKSKNNGTRSTRGDVKSSSESDANAKQQSPHKAFDDLLLAATIMQSKEQKEKSAASSSSNGSDTIFSDKNANKSFSSCDRGMIIVEESGSDDEN